VIGGETLNTVPADYKIRPLRDQLVVEATEVVYSKWIHVEREDKLIRGRVLAAGPGHYPKQYDHQDKHRRTKTWDSKRFQPCDVKVGDIVHLAGKGTFFEQFWWGDRLCLHCREADVAFIEQS